MKLSTAQRAASELVTPNDIPTSTSHAPQSTSVPFNFPAPSHNTAAARLAQIFPEHTSTLIALKNSNYGKAYSHCLKYRIYSSVLYELPEKGSGLTAENVVEWLGEQVHTWRNIKAKCRNAERALSTLRARHHTLTDQHQRSYRILKILMDSPLTVIPADSFNSAEQGMEVTEEELLDRNYKREAIKLKFKELERISVV
jgi:hypothetical protein